MSLLVEYQYFPPVYLFKALYDQKHIIFEQYEAYQKMSFRNRCIVAGVNGPISLSIPLQSGREQKTLTQEVRISNMNNWQQHHWRTIKSCYSRSPWFEYYRPALEAFYHTPYELLSSWNLDIFKWLIEKLALDVRIDFTTAYKKIYGGDESIDLRNKLLPKNYLTFPHAGYSQVFEEKNGFLRNLSILDLLFCTGKRAKDYLG